MRRWIYVLLAAARIMTPQSTTSPNLAGDWLGTLHAGLVDLRIVMHFVKTDTGFTGSVDSLDQGAKGIPLSSVSLSGAQLKVASDALKATYDGRVRADAIDGTWSQGSAALPLALKRVNNLADLERRRPQNPTKPYPYREEDVTYENKLASIRLAATLTLPSGNGPFPAVVLITGSGPQDRDESLMGHKPFLVLSDYLTRHGIAVLRADDRGVAQSGGVFATSTTADFATDTEAGIAYLETRPEVNPHKIGLIGHSEGGLIAPMIAARNAAVAFIVLMAGPGVPGDQILPAQVQLLSESAGKSPAEAEKAAQQERDVLALVKQEKDPATLAKQLKLKLGGDVKDTELNAQVQALNSPWFRYFIAYDPAPTLQKVKCPVLALIGSKDTQVPPQLNLPAIRQALEAGANKDSEVDQLPGLNHLFQTAKTGAVSEYAAIEETISPVALDKITTWIKKHE